MEKTLISLPLPLALSLSHVGTTTAGSSRPLRTHAYFPASLPRRNSWRVSTWPAAPASDRISRAPDTPALWPPSLPAHGNAGWCNQAARQGTDRADTSVGRTELGGNSRSPESGRYPGGIAQLRGKGDDIDGVDGHRMYGTKRSHSRALTLRTVPYVDFGSGARADPP